MGNRLSRREVVGVWGAAAWVCVRPDSVHYLGGTKLVRLVYHTSRYGMKYVDKGTEYYETQQRERQIRYLQRKAAQLRSQIIEVPAA